MCETVITLCIIVSLERDLILNHVVNDAEDFLIPALTLWRARLGSSIMH